MNIRVYRENDRADLISLWNEVFDYEAPHRRPAVALDAKLAVDDRIYLGDAGGSIAGSIMVGYDGHRGWLYSVAVAPPWRRTGLGTLLVRHAITELEQLGCLKIKLQVRSENAGVVAFYESLGFSVEPRISMGLRLGAVQESVLMRANA